jgi:hypothetical protein
MNITELIQEYKAEYVRTTGKELFCCSYSHGWFRVGDTAKVRRAGLERMLAALKSRPTVTRRQELVNGVLTWVEAHQHVVKHLLNGSDVIEDRDTPLCCSVSSETYWSM